MSDFNLVYEELARELVNVICKLNKDAIIIGEEKGYVQIYSLI